MEKVAVVGLGWLGLPLGKALQQDGLQVTGTTTRPEKLPLLEKEGFELSLLDLNKAIDQSSLRSFLQGTAIAVINIPPGKANFQSYKSQCLALVALFPGTTRFVFTSSTSVYGDQVAEATEDTPVLTDYNFTSQLFLAEKALRSELGERLTILRLAGLFGENRNPARHLAGKTGVKNPDSPVNLVHRDDCIAFIREVIRQETWGECFNVCASEHPSREAFYAFMCEREKLEAPQFEQEDQSSVRKIVSNEKGKRALNFSYRYDSPFDF